MTPTIIAPPIYKVYLKGVNAFKVTLTQTIFQGPPGPQGPQGPQGESGVASEDELILKVTGSDTRVSITVNKDETTGELYLTLTEIL